MTIDFWVHYPVQCLCHDISYYFDLNTLKLDILFLDLPQKKGAHDN